MHTSLVLATDTNHDDTDQDDVSLSAECAAVVLTSGGAIGGLTAPFVVPQLLALLGFTSTGVAAGSFASWWQSTIPVIAKGSLFATLQSIAMGGAGHYSTIVIGSTLGGSVSAQYLQEFCFKVDEEVKSKTEMGRLITQNLALVSSAGVAAKWTKEKAGAALDWTMENASELAKDETVAKVIESTGKVAAAAKEKAGAALDWTMENAWELSKDETVAKALDWTMENAKKLSEDEKVAKVVESTGKVATAAKATAQAAASWTKQWATEMAREKAQEWAKEENPTYNRWGKAFNDLLA
ncbi:expressed unknown protein [Seminavis robusta]|uniref:Uncharacterized protein n=1 Tax=Seminavis robusta TaxID=568900 RepID=A0A9N8E4W3_9STRA|nr:expressed unknown protein [Seminavis robusta]|eukprot:Sro504_g155930.2  (296) ;mRNA; r:11270-12157